MPDANSLDAPSPESPPPAEEMSLPELLGWIEFSCWTMLLMCPVIYWLQGPSVSTDQYVTRTVLVVLAAVGAVGLRGWVVLKRRLGRR